MVTGRSQQPRPFLSTKMNAFTRASLVVVALMGIVGSCRVINAELQERNAWKRYRDLEGELGLHRGMAKGVLTRHLHSKGIEYELVGDPSRPADEFPPQVMFIVVAKWTGPVFPRELVMVAELAADGALIGWRPLLQGGP